MPTAQVYSEDILEPISPDEPAGKDLRWTPQWDRIKEARRADDGLVSGKWAKKEQKDSDWRLTQDLSVALLSKQSKDLQLALWLTEAGVHLHGLAGLRDGLKIMRELMARFWDDLYPKMEDGPEDRAGPFEWLNEKFIDSISAIPITLRNDQGDDYSLNDLRIARRVGSAANYMTADGEIDSEKKKNYDQAIADGHISMEMFESAAKATSRVSYEDLNLDCQEACEQFAALEKIIDEKFGVAAPNLSAFRNTLGEVRLAIESRLEKARLAEPTPSSVPGSEAAASGVAAGGGAGQIAEGTPSHHRSWSALSSANEPGSSRDARWEEAEVLIRSGAVEKGLAEMGRLAADETTGKSRFQRKLLLAEACLASKREHLARAILEELAEQIDKYQLELWESPALISSVWGRLSLVYKHGGDTSDLERANKLYQRLCRLDPWQALTWGEG
jgi:type VI secretion system protein ImpA